jgi:hypothetical protein
VTDLPPEQLANFTPGGPLETVQQWLDLIYTQHDLAAAWPLTEADYRLVMAQLWICNTASPNTVDRDAIAAAIVDQVAAHPDWSEFAEWVIEEFLRPFCPYDAETWGFLSVVDVVAPGWEAVAVSDTGGESTYVPEGEHLQVNWWIARAGEDGLWRVACNGRHQVIPGWPPTSRPLAERNS